MWWFEVAHGTKVSTKAVPMISLSEMFAWLAASLSARTKCSREQRTIYYAAKANTKGITEDIGIIAK
jgi:hypothetical protein